MDSSGSSSGLRSTPSKKHIAALDGVRGVAVLYVVALHYGGGASSSSHTGRLVGKFCHFGWSGVSLFFVLSGFLITGILWDGKHKGGWIKNFYGRRLLRIFPLYYGCLLLILIVGFAQGIAGPVARKLIPFFLYLQNVPQLNAVANNVPTPLPPFHFWSLAVEEQFYLIWPFLLGRMTTRRGVQILAIAVFVASLVGRFAVAAHLSPAALSIYSGWLPYRSGEIAAGAFLAMCYRGPEWNAVRKYARPGLALCFCFVVVFFFRNQSLLGSALTFSFGLAAATLFYACLLARSLGSGLTRRVMENAGLRWFGKYSYGIYVYHILLGGVFEALMLRWTAHLQPSLGAIVVRAGMLALSLAVAWLSFQYFESPIMRLNRYFTGGGSSAPATSTPAPSTGATSHAASTPERTSPAPP